MGSDLGNASEIGSDSKCRMQPHNHHELGVRQEEADDREHLCDDGGALQSADRPRVTDARAERHEVYQPLVVRKVGAEHRAVVFDIEPITGTYDVKGIDDISRDRAKHMHTSPVTGMMSTTTSKIEDASPPCSPSTGGQGRLRVLGVMQGGSGQQPAETREALSSSRSPLASWALRRS